jgi:hypothetical protein
MATAKKTSSSGTAKKSSTSKSTAASSGSRSRASAPRASARKRMSGMAVAREAAQQLLELTGREAEGVTSLERTDDGWRIEVEVVEVRRIPDTTDVLAIYEIEADEEGNIEGYRRLRRYSRGTGGED